MVDYAHLSNTARSLGVSMTTNPTVNHDAANGWAVGSIVINTTTGVAFICASNAQGAALWQPMSSDCIGSLLGANMNVTTDQAFVMYTPAGVRYRITKITATNASISLTTAAGGVYPAAAKAGTAAVASTQLYSGLTAAAKAVDLTLANQDALAAASVMYLSLTTAQGAAATADLYIFGQRLFQ